MWLATENAGSEVAAPYVPVDAEVLAEIEVVDAGALFELPVANGRELDFEVHGHRPACQFARARYPDDAEVVRMGANGTVVSSVEPVCRPRFLADGRFVATAGFGDGDLRSAMFDPRDLATDPTVLPDGLGQIYLGTRSVVVGSADEGAKVLVSIPEVDGWGQALDLLDLDSGERRRLVEPRDIGVEGARIASADLWGDHLVVVTAEDGAVGGEAIPWVGHRMDVVTQMWFGRVDGEFAPLRQMASLPPTEDEPGRTMLPPRIIDGPGGPLVVSLETAHPIEGRWEVVLTSPDGASRIVGRVPGESSSADGTQLALGQMGGSEGGSLDAAGTQVLIAGAAMDPARSTEPLPIGLVLDLADGVWYRLPEPVDAAGFVTDPPG